MNEKFKYESNQYERTEQMNDHSTSNVAEYEPNLSVKPS